jgi:hypothetical protein
MAARRPWLDSIFGPVRRWLVVLSRNSHSRLLLAQKYVCTLETRRLHSQYSRLPAAAYLAPVLIEVTQAETHCHYICPCGSAAARPLSRGTLFIHVAVGAR